MHRLVLAIAAFVLAAGWVFTPMPGRASCAGTATLQQVADQPGVAVFTGRAKAEMPGSHDVVFAVERWFHGTNAAQVVRLLGWSAGLVEPAFGVVQVSRPNTTAGDAISLVRDELILMVADSSADSEGFAVHFCSIAGVPLDSLEGRAALRTAVAVFGPGLPAAELPATDTLDPGATGSVTTPFRLCDWWLLIFASALATTIVLIIHRLARRHGGVED